MLWKPIAEFLINEHDSIVYVAGIDDYELKYMNAKAKELFGIAEDDTSYLGKKCHKVFFDKDTPCEFCKNPILNNHSFCRWDSYNDVFKEHFYHRSKLISIEGEDYHFEIADIYTDRVKRQLETEHQLETQKTLIRCIHTLAADLNVHSAITSLLEIVTEYHKGDRAYLFEIDWDLHETSNTYEWAIEGVSRERDNLQHIPLNVIPHWIQLFQEQGAFYISNLEEHEHPDSEAYSILQTQNIESLIAVPLIRDNVITGFIGVDNRRKNYDDFTLLTSITYFMQNDLEKRRVTEKLKNLSYKDCLTGMFNRHMYNQTTEDLKDTPLSTLGIIYLDLNGLKGINDSKGHEAGDELLRKTASIIRSLFRDDTYRIGGDEFVIILPGIPEKVFHDRIVKLRDKFGENQVQVSIGSCWRDQNINIIEQVRIADEAMYKEKEEYYLESEKTI